MRVLALSAYDAGSHRYWLQGLESLFEQWQWRKLTLPPRHFSWRVRGNPLYWSLAERDTLEDAYDLLLATSLVDLATLRGLVPCLTALPTVLYFHENQFAYPAGRHRHGMLEAQIASLYSALAADRVAFNSAYNRDTFLAGCDDLLRRLPDYAPREAVELVAARSSVVPVAVQVDTQGDGPALWSPGQAGQPRLRLVWTGRLEHDKGGDGLLRLLQLLEREPWPWEIAVVGQQFREVPRVFLDIRRDYGHRLVHFGYLDARADYLNLLRGADVVLSTAMHEFQGLAVMEAVSCGCVPLLPDRLAYPENYPAHYLYDSVPDDPAGEAASALARLRDYRLQLADGALQPPDLRAFSPRRLRPRYAALFEAAMGAPG